MPSSTCLVFDETVKAAKESTGKQSPIASQFPKGTDAGSGTITGAPSPTHSTNPAGVSSGRCQFWRKHTYHDMDKERGLLMWQGGQTLWGSPGNETV